VKGTGANPCELALKLRKSIPKDRGNGPAAKFYEDVCEFRYDDSGRIEDPMQKHGDRIGAIVMASSGYPLHWKTETPKLGFLEETGKLANRHKAVLGDG
jgi:glutamate-1-semialdehyde aminotransferase